MKLHLPLLAVGLGAFLLISMPAYATNFEPAAFRTDKFSLAEQISFPWDHKEGQDFNLSIACTTQVTRRGRLKYPFCLGGNKESKAFEQLILQATKRARMIPARVNGKLKSVVLKFTTIFSRVDGAAAVTVVPNHFLNNKELGMYYTAPQLLRLETRDYPATCRSMNVIMKITVAADGLASNAQLHQGDPKATSCIKAIKRRIRLRHYIPGMVKGVPTAMDHLYLVGWRGGWAVYGGTR